MIPYGRQDISQSDVDAVVQVLRSDFLTQGPMVPRVEQAVAARVGASYAVGTQHLCSLGELRSLLRCRGGFRRHRSAHL
jgi:dTDP-4-amino-4,6-dideoxygalactose transaminase